MTLIPTQSCIIGACLETAAACILACCYSGCENHAATFVCMLPLGLESGLSNNFTFHLFSSQVAEQSDSPVKIPGRWHAAWRGTFCDFDKGLTEECRKNSFCFPLRVWVDCSVCFITLSFHLEIPASAWNQKIWHWQIHSDQILSLWSGVRSSIPICW